MKKVIRVFLKLFFVNKIVAACRGRKTSGADEAGPDESPRTGWNFLKYFQNSKNILQMRAHKQVGLLSNFLHHIFLLKRISLSHIIDVSHWVVVSD